VAGGLVEVAGFVEGADFEGVGALGEGAVGLGEVQVAKAPVSSLHCRAARPEPPGSSPEKVKAASEGEGLAGLVAIVVLGAV